MAASVPPLKFDLDLSGNDMTIGPSRDVAIVAGSAMVNQRVSLRLKAASGTALGDPGYGADLATYIGNPLTPVEQEGAVAEITTQALLDPLVTAVANLAVTTSPDGLLLRVSGDLGVADAGAFTPLSATISA